MEVGDSTEQNGSYKIEWYIEKLKLVMYRVRMGMSADLSQGNLTNSEHFLGTHHLVE